MAQCSRGCVRISCSCLDLIKEVLRQDLGFKPSNLLNVVLALCCLLDEISGQAGFDETFPKEAGKRRDTVCCARLDPFGRESMFDRVARGFLLAFRRFGTGLASAGVPSF